jgi:hypothetical protein
VSRTKGVKDGRADSVAFMQSNLRQACFIEAKAVIFLPLSTDSEHSLK